MILINKYIDHTSLKPTATPAVIKALCEEAIKHDFHAVCVAGHNAAFAKARLQQSQVQLAVVVGFPLGSCTTAVKVFETKEAIKNGATEIDMVLNIGALKAADYTQVKNDIAAVKQACDDVVLKVIFENCYLTQEEIVKACKICLETGVDFIKTSTGFGTGGATIDDVKLMKTTVGDRLKIKASGGIRDQEAALKFIKAGADRIGTSSGIQILKTDS